MLFKFFLPVCLPLFLLACNRRPATVNDTVPEAMPEPDTAMMADAEDLLNAGPESLAGADPFFPAYKITDRSLGLVLEFSDEGDGYADALFASVVADPWRNPVVDSNAVFILQKDDRLSDLLVAEAETAGFYVAGTKGDQPVRFADAVYYLDEEGCRSGFVLVRFKDYDGDKNGFPLFCTTAPPAMERCYCEDLNEQVRAYEKTQAYDYTDSVKTRVLATKDSLVFTYSDDFAWDQGRCLFPTRKIFVQKENKLLKPLWSAGLDLFGVPCD